MNRFLARVSNSLNPLICHSRKRSIEYGRQEIEKYSVTGNQTNFSPAKFREIQVPHFLDSFQRVIDRLVGKAYQFLENSKLFYQRAEDLLLSELGLKDWQPTEETVAVKSFSESFLSSDRLDAEHYQTKYDELESKFNQFDMLNIRQFISYPVSSGATPKAGGDDYTDEENGVPFMRAVDLKDGRVDTNNFIYIKDYVHASIVRTIF